MQTKLWKKAVCLKFAIFLSWGFFPAPGDSAGSPKVYTDKFGYFSFIPPAGWTEGPCPAPKKNQSKVIFSTLGEKVVIHIIAQPATPEDKIFANLLADTKRSLENMRRQRPEGKYKMQESTICGKKCVRADVEWPGQIIEGYIFTENGIRTYLSYAAVNRELLEKFRKTAMDSLCTIKLKGKK
ncbi:MAG: hypothetical protein PHX53_06645 [Syntrophales bacterium]|nr:hypothetical protein [Syntrophales bacterium]